jgi:hypothetical protein
MDESFFCWSFWKILFGKMHTGGSGGRGAKEREGYVLVIKPQLKTQIGYPPWFSHNPKNPLKIIYLKLKGHPPPRLPVTVYLCFSDTTRRKKKFFNMCRQTADIFKVRCIPEQCRTNQINTVQFLLLCFFGLRGTIHGIDPLPLPGDKPF